MKQSPEKKVPEGDGTRSPERREFLKTAGMMGIRVAVAVAGFSASLSAKPAHAETEAETEAFAGLPKIFAPGTKWGFLNEADHDARVHGVMMAISAQGEVTVTQNGQPVPFEIKDRKIVLGGKLQGCEIKEFSVVGLSAIVINGVGNEEEARGKAGDFLDERQGFRSLGKLEQIPTSPIGP